ncbi:hypothetical protein GCM10020219_030510 [Nonomuraea dietziae]
MLRTKVAGAPASEASVTVFMVAGLAAAKHVGGRALDDLRGQRRAGAEVEPHRRARMGGLEALPSSVKVPVSDAAANTVTSLAPYTGRR